MPLYEVEGTMKIITQQKNKTNQKEKEHKMKLLLTALFLLVSSNAFAGGDARARGVLEECRRPPAYWPGFCACRAFARTCSRLALESVIATGMP